MNSAIIPMTAERAAYFMRRFKKEEKLLGPNEQAALDYVIELLKQPQVNETKMWEPSLKWCNHCGEGVTDFCRGKGDKCVYELRKAGQLQAQTQDEIMEAHAIALATHCVDNNFDSAGYVIDHSDKGYVVTVETVERFNELTQPHREIVELSENKSTKEQESSVAITSAFLNRTLAERIKDAETKAKAVRELRATLGKQLNRGRGR